MKKPYIQFECIRLTKITNIFLLMSKMFTPIFGMSIKRYNFIIFFFKLPCKDLFWYVLSRDGSIIRNEFLEIHENSLKLLFETHFSCHWSEQPWLSLWMRKWWNSIAKSKTKKLPYLFHFRRGIKFFKNYKLDCVSWIKKFARNCILYTDFFKSLRSC